jgi:hypothetical protein
MKKKNDRALPECRVGWCPADMTSSPHAVLYQKNIEAVCSSEAEVREQIHLTAQRE